MFGCHTETISSRLALSRATHSLAHIMENNKREYENKLVNVTQQMKKTSDEM